MDNSGTFKHLIAEYTTPCWVSILVIVLLSINSSATTIIVTISDSGISMATDSKYGLISTAVGRIGEGGKQKAIIVKHRIVIACIGRCSYTLTPPPSSASQKIENDFPAWILDIERSLPDNVSFDDVVMAVDNKLRKMVPALQAPLRGGGINRQSPLDVFEKFFTLVIAGYQNRSPRLTIFELYIDWQNEIMLGPYQLPLEPINRPAGRRSEIYSFGVHEAHTNFANPKSYAYKQAMARCPKALQDFITYRSIPLDETMALASVLVGIEEQTNPNDVGGRIRRIEVVPNGGAQELDSCLPEAAHKKQQTKTE